METMAVVWDIENEKYKQTTTKQERIMATYCVTCDEREKKGYYLRVWVCLCMSRFLYVLYAGAHLCKLYAPLL